MIYPDTMTEYFTLSIFNKYLMENVTSVPIYDISSKTVVLLDSCKGNKELVFFTRRGQETTATQLRHITFAYLLYIHRKV